jgi:hypothetical protein
MSPLEERLRAALGAETSEYERAHLKSELALYWARTGQFSEAEALRAELRSGYGQGQNTRISILIMLLEGLLHFFQALSPDSRDRVNRANLLSSTFRERDLLALTSAWLAHIDFNLCRFDAMATSLATCVANLEFDTGSANVRISLLLGDIFLFLGARQESQAWYERGRRAATSLGDQAAIGALTYNRAALRVASLRVEAVRRPLSPDDLQLLDVEVRSAINYQAIARLQSLDHLLQFAQVGSQMLSQRYESANKIIEKLLGHEAEPLPVNERALLLADRAECFLHLGDTKQSDQYSAEATKLPLDSLEPDDSAVVNASLARSCSLRGDKKRAEEYAKRAVAALAIHDSRLAHLRMLTQPYLNPQLVRAGNQQ